MTPPALLQIENLQITVGSAPVIRGLSLTINQGELLGLVGESGCGKSLTALSVMRLLESPLMQMSAGKITFDGKELQSMPERELQNLRGCEISMIFQEPMTSLNPVFSVGKQIMETLRLHTDASKSKAREHTIELLERVGIPSAKSMFDRYPHQLSGGQRQRIMIAIALACEPQLLIADEPTTALDVTVQAQILSLLKELHQQSGMATLFITHDLGVIRNYCDRVAVMYCGQIVEQGTTRELFENPKHPYTRALLNTMPAANEPGTLLPSIEGTVPDPANLPTGCAFSPRCSNSIARCQQEDALLSDTPHQVRCWNPVT